MDQLFFRGDLALPGKAEEQAREAYNMKRTFLIWPAEVTKQSALYPPLGLASLGAVLKQQGFAVEMVDLTFDEAWRQIHSLNGQGDIYGISLTSSLYGTTKRCIDTIRSRDKHAKFVLGGPHASVLPEETLKELGAEVVCMGEAEISFPLVIKALENDGDLAGIKGIAFRDKDDRVTITADIEKIENLDELPFPDQSLFPYERYFRAKGFRELSLVTSRGCPGECIFCQPTLEKMFGKKVRFHSSDYVIRQIQMMKEKFKLDFFVVSDDTFVTNRKRVIDLCERIRDEKIDIFWRCQSRVSLLDRKIIKKLKSAGCFMIALGVESGSQKILDLLQKGIRVEKIKEVFRICHEEGMLTHAYLMIGSEGETRQTVEETKDLLKTIRPFSSNICVTTPYPGTFLHQRLRAQGLLGANTWEKYDHLISDTIHIETSTFNLSDVNRFKATLLRAQKYPVFRLICLLKVFLDLNNLQRLTRLIFSNPGIIVRGARLFCKSIFSNLLEVSNPKTKAYKIFAENSETEV